MLFLTIYSALVQKDKIKIKETKKIRLNFKNNCFLDNYDRIDLHKQ